MGKDNDVNGKTSLDLFDRIYFLGEIFWIERAGWYGSSFGSDPNKLYRPGIVAKKSPSPLPVMFVPGTSKLSSDNAFNPREIENNRMTRYCSFIMKFRRPVDRKYIHAYLGTISSSEKQRLAAMIADIYDNSRNRGK